MSVCIFQPDHTATPRWFTIIFLQHVKNEEVDMIGTKTEFLGPISFKVGIFWRHFSGLLAVLVLYSFRPCVLASMSLRDGVLEKSMNVRQVFNNC